jgi:hypothetical protein
MPLVRTAVRGRIQVIYGVFTLVLVRFSALGLALLQSPWCHHVGPFIAEGSVSKPIQSSKCQAASEVAAIAYK